MESSSIIGLNSPPKVVTVSSALADALAANPLKRSGTAINCHVLDMLRSVTLTVFVGDHAPSLSDSPHSILDHGIRCILRIRNDNGLLRGDGRDSDCQQGKQQAEDVELHYYEGCDCSGANETGRTYR